MLSRAIPPPRACTGTAGQDQQVVATGRRGDAHGPPPQLAQQPNLGSATPRCHVGMVERPELHAIIAAREAAA